MTTQNPVFFDSTANVHRPMDAGATVPVTAIPVSATTGNRTQVLGDGVYSGDYSGLILYVDSVNGIDTNVGTKAAPLKTIDKAFANLNALFPVAYSGRNITIALKAGQNYPWTTSFNMSGDCDLKIAFYGDTKYGDFNSAAVGTGADPWNMSDLARPNLLPASSVQTGGLQQLAGINRRGGTIAFLGLLITLPAAPNAGAPISAYSGYCDVVRSLSPALGMPLGDDGGVHLLGSIVNMSDITAYWGFIGTFARATCRLSQFCSQFQIGGVILNAAASPTTAQLAARQYFIKFLADAAGNNQSTVALSTNSSNSSAGSGLVFAMWSEAQALVVTGTTTNQASYPLSFDPGYGLVNYIFNLSKTANGQSLNFLNTRLF
jgi:hypothetical protein